MTSKDAVGERAPLTGEAGLGMYPYADLRPAYDALWSAVHGRAPWLPERLTWHDDVHVSWTSPDLVVGYTCGWPLVTRLADVVQVVGTFEFDVPGAEGPSYRSVLVAREAAPPASFAGAVAAVNDPDSLSGWVSLIAAVHGPGGRWTGPVTWTGAHVESVRAVQSGEAAIASIDAVTWHHVQRFAPELAEGLAIVGRGPLVPCLPVVAGPRVPAEAIDELADAFARAVSDPALAPVAADLRVRSFVRRTLADYLPLLQLAPGS
jgi:ABC-type phosphate/phosphonate transport system substrate-binding protein